MAESLEISRKDQELRTKQLKIEQLTHEMATLKRWRFARSSERLDSPQRSLLEETIDEDLEAIELEVQADSNRARARARSASLAARHCPRSCPRREIPHEPEHTVCGCGCALERIGEDVSEKLDYTPGSFSVERHVRGKWVCRSCQTSDPGPGSAAGDRQGDPDLGAPGAGADRQVCGPRCRSTARKRSLPVPGLALPRSTLAEWVGRLRREAAAAGRCPEGASCSPRGPARR